MIDGLGLGSLLLPSLGAATVRSGGADGGMRVVFTCVLLLSIRMVVTAEHTEEDIQRAVSCIREAASALLK